jgi:hypothetical protein
MDCRFVCWGHGLTCGLLPLPAISRATPACVKQRRLADTASLSISFHRLSVRSSCSLPIRLSVPYFRLVSNLGSDVLTVVKMATQRYYRQSIFSSTFRLLGAVNQYVPSIHPMALQPKSGLGVLCWGSISPLLPCLVTSAPEDWDSMFLRNVDIDLQIHTAPKPKTSTTR